jgi:RimJ/RimL family protein N-acetyltransferase
MVTNVTVTRAVEDDAAEILDLLRQVSEETDYLSFAPGRLGISLDEEKAYLRSLDDPGAGTMLKAVVDGAIAGTAGITRGKSLRTAHAGVVGISVVRKHWGQGIGRALMHGIVNEGVRLGLRRLSLTVRADNARAIALYESIGFRHEGRLVGAFAVGETLYDDLQMGLLYDALPAAP